MRLGYDALAHNFGHVMLRAGNKGAHQDCAKGSQKNDAIVEMKCSREPL